MRDSDSKPAPPIPPRRLKRKNKPQVNLTDEVAESSINSAIQSERRPRLPPPPPPQRSIPRRGFRPQLLASRDVGEKIPPGRCPAEICHSKSINEDKFDTGEVGEVQPSLSTFGTTVRVPFARGNGKKPTVEEPECINNEKVKIVRPNEYPPLFFTIQDFQDVMNDVDNSYSRTLRNMTTFEPTPKPRASKISISELPETPEKGQVLFRVTTTNLPFEKSLSEWSDVRNDPNHFIFDDYVDRRQIPAQRKSKLVLFGDDTFDRDDEDRTISTSHTASRVRFLVDYTENDESGGKIAEMDSLQNIDSLPLDCLSKEGASRDENEDEFGDIPFDSLLNATNEDPLSLCIDPSEDSTSSNTDFQTILVTAMVEPVPLVAVNENDKVSDTNIESTSVKKDPTFLSERVHSKDGEPKSSYGDTDDVESYAKCESERSLTCELSDKVHDREKDNNGTGVTDPQRENKKIISVEKSLREFMDEGYCEDKSPPENVRRNSFLMNMLDGVVPDERAVCKVVATHPKPPIHGSKRHGFRDEEEPSTAIEAKIKLLGELSTSFSAIKLKPVINVEEVEDKQSASDLKVDSMKMKAEAETEAGKMEYRDVNDDCDDLSNDMKYKLNRNLDSVLDINVVKCKLSSEPIEESRISRNEPQDRSNVCSQKTDQINDKYVENINTVWSEDESKIDFIQVKNHGKESCNNDDNDIDDDDDNGNDKSNHERKMNNNNNNHTNLEVASESSVDKCAIVLKCNNNNDNNAMTPVDVSYDQSQNNVSIIPGSVRSFVKFYEIQGETSVGLNSNDTVAVPKIKVEPNRHSSDYFHEINSQNIITQPIPIEIENDIKYTIVARKPVLMLRKQEYTEPDQNQIVNERQDLFEKLNKPVLDKAQLIASSSKPVKLCEMDVKGYGRLNIGPSLVGSTSFDQDEQEETTTKRRGESRSRESASNKAATVTTRMNSAASGIALGTQDGSTSAVTRDVVRSGTTNHLVPKSSTSTINEHYTFYCTV